MTPNTFWLTSNKIPDLVNYLHQQVRLVRNYGLNVRVPCVPADLQSLVLDVAYIKYKPCLVEEFHKHLDHCAVSINQTVVENFRT